MNKAHFTDSMGVARTGHVLDVSPTHVKVEVIIDGRPWVDWIPGHMILATVLAAAIATAGTS